MCPDEDNQSTATRRSLHCLNVVADGGMERLLQCYAQSDHAGNDAVFSLNTPHDNRMRPFIDSLPLPFGSLTTLAGLRLPEQPKWIRRCKARIAARSYTQTVFWNCLPDRHSRPLTDNHRAIYYDHSLAWYRPPRYARADEFLDMAIACSTAGARMLRLNWGFSGPVHVCHNPAIHERMRPAGPKPYPRARPFRIGMAGRLTGAKGFSLGLFALASLVATQHDCELIIAGSGDGAASLKALGERLGVSERIAFLGQSGRMDEFYDQIDCLLHPNIHEPGGLVLREATAAGCPVVTTRVDGNSEWFAGSLSAQLITPEVPINRFVRELGGSDDDLPSCCYDPLHDRLCEPAAPDPERLADGLRYWIDDPDVFEKASRAALELAEQKQISPERYVAALASLLGEPGND